ncbi:1-phosphofructokinase [Mycoplasmopsis felis]|uniref:1-phosphofructokinase n=1 Tax=Mycoplasmopsis felis TaxID=33923 RepID=UPI00056BAAE8|nr:1-phosphofructokinase family hexose kinase [Mycoplasmopsis felis]WQQ04617.1 1-phosphofructokinase family hexose kinase [Mycoplasmopsis felis]WQQ06324.1 1-phosphofructokinase family hexose kinase [Mycoplasmopsis felis]WQQ06815.1 1-phosphofructokinase family hexose kinase [Mycoplasmopsis felis]WQQ11953.1 1-phosphofructokinase family hexose kinase [Mycoplasmopsis felis]
MIYTLTLSPSIDLFISSDNFELNSVNRYSDFELLPGGKGLNASIMLKRHGFDNIALTLFDNETHKLLSNFFNKENLNVHNINYHDKTRINIKYYGKQNNFELNGPRTNLNNNEFQEVIDQISKLNKNDVLMLMGIGNEEQLFEILNIVSKNNVKLILDIESSKFIDLLKFKPFLIKPNVNELKQIFNYKQEVSQEWIVKSMLLLQEYGALNIIVSDGSNGSYLLTSNKELYQSKIKEKVNLVSATGAGDTLISIFSAEYIKTSNPIDSFQKATASSIGTVTVSWLGNSSLTEQYLNNVDIKKLNI